MESKFSFCRLLALLLLALILLFHSLMSLTVIKSLTRCILTYFFKTISLILIAVIIYL